VTQRIGPEDPLGESRPMRTIVLRNAYFLGVMGVASWGCAVSTDVVDLGPFPSESGELELDFANTSFRRGDNEVTVCVTERRSGEPALGLELEVVPFMPSMGHGSSGPSPSKALGDGCYEFQGVVFNMPGTWELRTEISGAFEDSATLTLSVR
jgi:hypothetical protein